MRGARRRRGQAAPLRCGGWKHTHAHTQAVRTRRMLLSGQGKNTFAVRNRTQSTHGPSDGIDRQSKVAAPVNDEENRRREGTDVVDQGDGSAAVVTLHAKRLHRENSRNWNTNVNKLVPSRERRMQSAGSQTQRHQINIQLSLPKACTNVLAVNKSLHNANITKSSGRHAQSVRRGTPIPKTERRASPR